MSRIVVTPLSQLATQITLHRPSHVLTLTSGESAALPAGHGASRLTLIFNDIVEPREGLVAPDESHVSALIDFVQGWPQKAPLLIHCYAGISRSTAAACIAALALDRDMDERCLAERLRRLSPSATPNIRLISIADTMLGRRGRMVEAIKAIGRGAEAYEGEVFSLPVKD
ncbi:tyrosine protein phosphatase [Brucella sp. 10RB9212]|uniref:tyrosine phosphatase family protein n=1 Tax=unclassified Brucella TaxID=2632610 RepID=UPI00097289A0|nr:MULTISPECIES: tyrosine phosphatase family protein [unclassified Brucella]APY13243.1 tyrosine protein phosphatase [Brucella sp. 09RB8910]MRN46205.1 tyrosine protein phosphatase [Brucella sp. 10RB9212]